MGKKGEETKQHIRISAFKLFAEYGYTKVTMQDICTTCGLSKGGLYRHYEDKRHIFTDILKMLQKEEADREEHYMEKGMSAVEILNGYFAHIREDLNHTIPNINIALYEFCVEHKKGVGQEIVSRQYIKGEAVMLALIEYGVSRKEFHVQCPHGAGAAILFLVEGIRMANEVMPVPEETLINIFKQIKQLLGVTYEA